MDANVIRDLVEQNKKLMARIIEMQEKKKKPNTPAADEAEAEQAEPKPRRTTHPRVKPGKPQLRRSPRNHSPAPTPSPAKPGAAMRRRLSYTSAGTPEKRNTPTKDRQLVRATLGVALKMELDHLMLGQHFRDKERYFKVDEFRHHAMPIVNALHDDEAVDTSMYTKSQLFRLAVDIAKKRDFYVPKKKPKLNPTKKRKLRAAKAKRQALAAARAAACVAAAKQKTRATADTVAAKTAGGSDDAVAVAGSDDDATEVEQSSPATDATEDSDDVLALIQLNSKNQKNREEIKEALVKKKAAAAARKAADAAKAAAAKKKAEQEVTANYVKAKGAAAAAASKMKASSTKKLSAAKKQAAVDDCLLQVGQRVSGRWDNDDGTPGWYDGKIVSIDYEQRTAHILYDDDDIDDSVPWNNVRIL